MKNTIRALMSIITIALISSCSTYTISSFHPDQNNGSACPNPVYIATMSKASGFTINGNWVGEESLTLFSLLHDAQKKYGNDVTIQNVRWDIRNKNTKVSVIYDVITCK